jgi:hypothetical protein
LTTATSSSEVIVKRQDWYDGLKVSVGTVIRIPLPAGNEQWTVTYPHGLVKPLTDAEHLDRPDPKRGWRFKAIAPGSGEMTFVGYVPPDRSSGTDAPNPPRFVLQVTIR